MDKISALYSGMIAQQGRKFVIDRRWADPTVNAFAEQNTPGVDTIHMFGGLARHPEVTPDAMALVACHELGHHLGGAPKKLAGNWAANEGQADYWGAMKCLRHYFEGDNQQQALQGINIPNIVITKCQSQYSNNDEQLICERSAMAGLALAKLLSFVTKDVATSSYETPDSSVVAKTFDDHPKTQCRLDTFFNASLCDHTIREAGSDTNANTGVCSLRNGDKVGDHRGHESEEKNNVLADEFSAVKQRMDVFFKQVKEAKKLGYSPSVITISDSTGIDRAVLPRDRLEHSGNWMAYTPNCMAFFFNYMAKSEIKTIFGK
jgi:hypothetical protein